MATLFTWVSTLTDKDSETEKLFEKGLNEEANRYKEASESFGWQKHERKVEFVDRTVHQVYFSGYEKTTSKTDNYPDQLEEAFWNQTDPMFEVIWFSDENDQGKFTTDKNRILEVVYLKPENAIQKD